MPASSSEKPSFFESLYAARDADAHEICQGLFLGAASASEDRRAMQKRKISHVLIVHPALPEQHPGSFVYRRAALMDEPEANLLALLPDALGFLAGARAEGGRAFVYCAKGISRSSSVVMALLMLERGISFDEAFDACEKKRPVVYPNVGFQQQLRHLEALLAPVPSAGGWEARLRRLREAAPRGKLQGPDSPLHLREAIDAAVAQGLEAVEALAARVLSQPVLLQGRELWKRHGLLFENLRRYRALPADPALPGRARATAERLRALPKVFSSTLKGVQLGLAVAKELDGWAALGDAPPSSGTEPPMPSAGAGRGGERGREEAAGLTRDGPGTEEKGKEKGKEKDKKKDKKKSKEERKLERKLEKIERQAREAELAASNEHRAAEEAAKRADRVAAELDELEAEEDRQRESRRAAKRARSASRSRSGSRSRSRS